MIFSTLQRLFSRAVPVARPVIRPVPGGRLYVVGDIHGRADLLERMLARISEDVASSAPGEAGAELVLLGDYIDRGDQSAAVIERLVALRDDPPLPVQFLKGNHEAMMLDFLDGPERSGAWLRHGGLATLFSYGVRGITEMADAPTRIRAAEALAEALGAHGAFLRGGLVPMVRRGNVVCVHAGLDPALPVEDQDEETMLWGHPDFQGQGGPADMLVIHGHTITPAPDRAPGRLGIDTGAYYSGRLTAARVEAGRVDFLVT